MQNSPSLPTVLVVSDVRFVREVLGQVLAETEGLAVLGTATATDEGLRLAARLEPDIVLLDTATADGVAAAQELANVLPATKIVALAIPRSEQDLILLLEAGVLGYVTREQSLDDVVATIVDVARDEMVSSPTVRTLVGRHVRMLAAERHAPVHARLTTRERQILDLVAAGLSNKEIAKELVIELATVKNHVHNILEKLQVPTRAAAVAELRLRHLPIRISRAVRNATIVALAAIAASAVKNGTIAAVATIAASA
jgi:DNA-binding NarL/FixJ family response regulator